MNEKFIAERISALRIAKNVSEYQMSAELGKSAGYVQAITSGRSQPSVKQLFNIIDYFEMTPAEFFDPGNVDPPEVREALRLLRSLRSESVSAVLGLLRHVAELEQDQSRP